MIFDQKKEICRLVREPPDCLCNREASGATIIHADTPFFAADADGLPSQPRGSLSQAFTSDCRNPRRPPGVNWMDFGIRPASSAR